MFGAEGDTGAFSCIRSDGTTIVERARPAVAALGDQRRRYLAGDRQPGDQPAPVVPGRRRDGLERRQPLQQQRPERRRDPGFFWCATTGAGGGGSSQYWGRPFYQHGPGINNPYTTYGNGTTQCALAATGTPCREDPDISANADEYTPYAEYCTGNASTPFSVCATSAPSRRPAGSASAAPACPRRCGRRSSPTATASRVTAAATSTRCSTCCTTSPRSRTSTTSPAIGQTTNNNGLFPTTPGYDLATGIGTPIMAALITRSF